MPTSSIYTTGGRVAEEFVLDSTYVNQFIKDNFSGLSSCSGLLDVSTLATHQTFFPRIKVLVDKLVAQNFDCSNMSTFSLRHVEAVKSVTKKDFSFLSSLTGAFPPASSRLFV